MQDDFRMTSELTLNLGLRYEIVRRTARPVRRDRPAEPGGGNGSRSGRDGHEQLGAARWLRLDSPNTSNWLLGDRKIGVARRLRHRLRRDLLQPADRERLELPRVVSLNETQHSRILYPNKLTGSATPVFNPLERLDELAAGHREPGKPLLQPRRCSVRSGSYVFEVGYSGSRGCKGINQIEREPRAPHRGTGGAGGVDAEPAAIPGARRGASIPTIGSRILIPATAGPGDNDVEARSTYNAVFFSAQAAPHRGLQVNASYTYSKWMSNNDASLGEGGTGGSSQRPQSMFDYEAEWSRSQFDRPHRFTTSYIWEMPGPKDRHHAAGARRLAAVGCDAGAVRTAVHDRHGR